MDSTFVAIDLGATSGRVIAGRFPPHATEIEELRRFPNTPHRQGGHERWNFPALFDGLLAGLRRLPDGGREVASLGVDSWAVDYGLLDATGQLIEDPVCYRDPRTRGSVEAVHAVVPAAELFALTGLQVQPFNTLYQLHVHRRSGSWPPAAARLLLIPDLFHHALCGARSGEITMASTTQLLRAGDRQWAVEVFARLELPLAIMPPLRPPGTPLGRLHPELQAALGLAAIPVVAPATHDTASAVAGTPLEDGQAFLSSGTWSLLGVETSAPVLTAAVARENFTNEAGVEGTNRLLKNIMGLWILDECLREWRAAPGAPAHRQILDDLAAAPALTAFIPPDAPRFFHPQDMVGEVRAFLAETGQVVPDHPPALARIILESLGLRYAAVVRALEQLTGRSITALRVVGGGSRNDFLNQATADATGLEVLAGPAEATALGNLAVQAIAAGRFPDLSAARRHIAASFPARRFRPTGDPRWLPARERYARIEAGHR